MKPVDRLLATARAEIGYIEKETNAHLDDKTANAGDGNWNKYARDLDALGVVYNSKKNGYAWCDIFTDWCFIQTFGLELGLQLLDVYKRQMFGSPLSRVPLPANRPTDTAHSLAFWLQSPLSLSRSCFRYSAIAAANISLNLV